MLLIEAAAKFGKPIIEVARADHLVLDQQLGTHLTEAEIDQVNLQRFRELGFLETNGLWIYNGQPINMGTLLAVPESMRLPDAESGMVFEVSIETDVVRSPEGQVRVRGRTNLPDDTELLATIESPTKEFYRWKYVIAKGGSFESDWFTDNVRPAGGLRSGKYNLTLTTPTVSVLPASVRKIVGQRGQNMTGSFVHFDSVLGNRIKYETIFVVE